MTGTLLAAQEQVNSLPISPVFMGLIAFGILTALLLVTWTFHRR